MVESDGGGSDGGRREWWRVRGEGVVESKGGGGAMEGREWWREWELTWAHHCLCPFTFMHGHLCSCTFVFIHGRWHLSMHVCIHLWVVVFVCGQLCLFWVDVPLVRYGGGGPLVGGGGGWSLWQFMV